MKPDLGLSGCHRTRIFRPEDFLDRRPDFQPLLMDSRYAPDAYLGYDQLDWTPDGLPCITVFLSICFRILALICLVAAGTIVHWQGGSILGLLLGRFTTQLVLGTVLWNTNAFNIREGSAHIITTSMFGEPLDRMRILLSGLLYYVLIYTWWRGLLVVPLGDALALVLAISPLLMSLLARFIHRQPLHRCYTVPIFLTVVGTILITQPSFLFNNSSASQFPQNVSHRSTIPLSGGIQTVGYHGLVFLFAASIIASVIGSRNWTFVDEPHWLQLDIVAALQGVILTGIFLGIDYLVFQGIKLSGAQWKFDLIYVACSVSLGVLAFVGSAAEEMSIKLTQDEESFAPRLAFLDVIVLALAYFGQSVTSHEMPNAYTIVGGGIMIASIVIQYVQISSDDPLGAKGTEHFRTYGANIREYRASSDLDGVDGGGETFRAEQFLAKMTNQQKLFVMKERVTVMMS